MHDDILASATVRAFIPGTWQVLQIGAPPTFFCTTLNLPLIFLLPRDFCLTPETPVLPRGRQDSSGDTPIGSPTSVFSQELRGFQNAHVQYLLGAAVGHDRVGTMGWDNGTKLLSVPAQGVEGLPWAMCTTHIISQPRGPFYR